MDYKNLVKFFDCLILQFPYLSHRVLGKINTCTNFSTVPGQEANIQFVQLLTHSFSNFLSPKPLIGHRVWWNCGLWPLQEVLTPMPSQGFRRLKRVRSLAWSSGQRGTPTSCVLYGSHKNNASLVLRKSDECVPSQQDESNRGLSSTTWGSSNLLPWDPS